MSVDLKNAFRLSFVTGETELPIPAVSEILARLRSGPVWDVASIAPADDQFLLLPHVQLEVTFDNRRVARREADHIHFDL